MKKKSFLIQALLLFVLAFIFACSSDDDSEFYGFCLKGSCFEYPEEASSISSESSSSATVQEPVSSSSAVQEPTLSSSAIQEPTLSSSAVQEPTLSSSAVQEPTLSSSTVQEPESSSSEEPSSSSLFVCPVGMICGFPGVSSSSAVALPVLTCEGSLPNKATAGTRIPPPTVECDGIKVSNSNITWINAPNWNNPAKGNYTNIKATAKAGSGACSGMTASCEITGSTLNISNCGDFVDGTPRWHHGQDKPQFCDERDGQKYVYTEIEGQTWMAENLNYKASGSQCYGENGGTVGNTCYVSSDDEQDRLIECPAQSAPKPNYITLDKDYCNKYGRLYNWKTAKHANNGCPAGWHLPSREEWDNLTGLDGGYAGRFKASTDWWESVFNSRDNGYTDPYGFSALPGGAGTGDVDFFWGNWTAENCYDGELPDFFLASNSGFWWTSDKSTDVNTNAFFQTMYYNVEKTFSQEGDVDYLFSVRCIKND